MSLAMMAILTLLPSMAQDNALTEDEKKAGWKLLFDGKTAEGWKGYKKDKVSDGWKIVDVYYGAISQLATRRSDFAAPLASGGARGLIAHLDALSEKLLK